jgi:ATP-dependent DNA helicase RecQ
VNNNQKKTIPPDETSSESEEITPRLLLKRHFGFDTFRPGQETVIDALMRQGAALAVFPTGGGKSLCYQLPALALEGVTLVVSPLIALMKDQIDFLRRHGIRAARLDSSLSAQESQQVAADMRSGALKLLYVAPERFNNERFLSLIRQVKIGLFAIDEAHCISEWGHNFRPDYLKLAETARTLGAERILALTATATPSVVRDICDVFAIPPECAIVTGFYRANLNLATTPVRAEERDALLLKRLKARKPGPTIIYVTLQKTAEAVARLLVADGYVARAYHAGMESDDRAAVQEWWMAGTAHIVVATIAFGMGIDKANVRYVYHYNLSKSLESYSQEIGRAGRDDQRSTVEMFACPDDVATLENFAYGDMPTEDAFRSLLQELLNPDRPDAPEHPNTGMPDIASFEFALEFAVNMYELANRHDLRPLVLRTALTYLELGGVLKQGTPFYAGYAMRPLLPVEEIIAQFKGEPGRLIASLFERAQKGKTKNASWYRLNPDDMAELLGQERRRIVRALEVLEEKGLVELTASDVRQRYTLTRPDADGGALAADLTARFALRERQEVKRLQDVLALVTHDDCQTNALVGYFGQVRAAPCGHCTYCLAGHAQIMPVPHPLPPLPAGLDVEFLAQQRATHTDALKSPRQVARLLCGLTSPALTRARLGRHGLFGIWEAYRFGDVLAWCEAQFMDT